MQICYLRACWLDGWLRAQGLQVPWPYLRRLTRAELLAWREGWVEGGCGRR